LKRRLGCNGRMYIRFDRSNNNIVKIVNYYPPPTGNHYEESQEPRSAKKSPQQQGHLFGRLLQVAAFPLRLLIGAITAAIASWFGSHQVS